MQTSRHWKRDCSTRHHKIRHSQIELREKALDFHATDKKQIWQINKTGVTQETDLLNHVIMYLQSSVLASQ